MTSRLRVRLLPLLLLAAASCAGPDAAFVAASRAAHDAIAPEYRAYVDADLRLDAAQKARRLATLDLWREAIEVREAQR